MTVHTPTCIITSHSTIEIISYYVSFLRIADDYLYSDLSPDSSVNTSCIDFDIRSTENLRLYYYCNCVVATSRFTAIMPQQGLVYIEFTGIARLFFKKLYFFQNNLFLLFCIGLPLYFCEFLLISNELSNK